MAGRLNHGLILFLFTVAILLIMPGVLAVTSNLTVQSCAAISGTVTITNCTGLNTSSDTADITLGQRSDVALTMSDTTFTPITINSVTVTIRHGGMAGIAREVQIIMYDAVNAVELCTRDRTILNTEAYTTDSITACTPAGGWDTTKLDNLEVWVENRDKNNKDQYLSYLLVTVDYSCTVTCSADGDCDDSNSLTTDTCSNAGTCSASCSNTPCSIACNVDGDCDDSNSLTTDTCSNGGSCSANCSNVVCPVACNNDGECDDSNPLTLDTCSNAGTCSAGCSNVPCTPACSSDGDCDDSNSLTTDTCSNAGTCSASCSNSPCSIACNIDGDCDDSDPLTIDTCSNGGTCSASCSNTGCPIACSADGDCDDSNSLTTDTCSNAGTCSASCSNAPCSIACNVDGDCDDSEQLTIDTCNNAGTCSASCSNALAGCDTICNSTCADATCYLIDPDCDLSGNATKSCCGNSQCEGDAEESCLTCSGDCGVCPPETGAPPAVCGDGSCTTGENSCSCPSDCGTCSGDVANEVCRENLCVGGACQKILKLDCCGNALCETEEGFGTCGMDCKSPKKFTVSPLWAPYYLRGDSINLLVSVVADSVNAVGANVVANGFFGKLVLYDDGAHDDRKSNDGVFANTSIIGSDVSEGGQAIAFDINMLDTEKTVNVDINIFPRLTLDFSLGKNRYLMGDIIDLNGFVSRREDPTPASIAVKITSKGQAISTETAIANDKGFFESSYHSTTIDPPGKWVVSVKATDEYGNYELEEKELDVLEAVMSNFLWVSLTQPIVGSFKRGADLRIIVDVKDIGDDIVHGAVVGLVAPNGNKRELNEVQPGIYSGSYTIPWDLGLGNQQFEVTAGKALDGLAQEGSMSFIVPIEQTEFITELIEPQQTSFMVGDEVEFRVKMTYPSGEPVKESIVKAVINGEAVEMHPVSEGVYSTKYFVANLEMEKIEFSIETRDVYENVSSRELELDVSGVSINYYLHTFPVTVFLLVFAAALAIIMVLLYRLEAHSLSSLEKKEAELVAQKKEVETRYFVQGTIDRGTFNKIKSQIGPELESVRGEITAMKEKIGKRKQAVKGK